MTRIPAAALLLLCLAVGPSVPRCLGSSDGTTPPRSPRNSEELNSAPLSIPNVPLVNQDGKAVHIDDVLRGKTAAVNFIFTSCTTVCSPMGANFAALQSRLGDRADVALVSVSIDPTMDTPAKLKAWSERFHAKPGWTLLTGQQRDVEALLKAFGVYTPNRFTHAPVVMIGSESSGRWTRANGLAPVADLVSMIDAAGATNHARNYFTDVQLVDQNGKTQRLYDDLMSGKTVIITSFFATCQGACPVIAGRFEELQKHLGDRIGRDVTLLSISLDPENDTPAKLKAYAHRVHAQKGWYFLTGRKENVELVLRKLGQYVEDKSDHLNVILIGNDRTGLWKKAFGLAPAKDLIRIVDSVVNDKG